jgi:hypothetical protein
MARTHFLFNGAVLSGVTAYVPLPISGGTIGAQIAWLDATSAATLTVETTDYGAQEAPLSEDGAAWEWKGSGLTITGPTGAAAGSTCLNIENVRQKRARLKIVASANCLFQVLDGEVYPS